MLKLWKTRLPIFLWVWPVHPRSRNRAEQYGLWERLEAIENLHLLEPIGYLDNVRLMHRARLVLTDSGGVQEETTHLRMKLTLRSFSTVGASVGRPPLGVPCLTARENTERPITISEGTNTLAGTGKDRILQLIREHLSNGVAGDKELPKPKYWDGKTAGRIVKILMRDA